MKRKSNNITFGNESKHLKIFIGLMIVLTIIYAINIFITSSMISPSGAKVQIKYLIDSSCNECVNLSSISAAFEKQGVSVKGEKFIEYDSNEGRNLIEKFGVKQIPAVLISEEIDNYPDIKDALIKANATKKEGFYAVHSTLPPYIDLKLNEIVGLIEVIYLKDNSCSSCYDVRVIKQILARFGMNVNNPLSYDISSQEGKDLINKYNIEKVPTILISPDAKYYEVFVGAWSDVGTIENDGWFVMKNPEVLGIVKDLTTNKLINSSSQS